MHCRATIFRTDRQVFYKAVRYLSPAMVGWATDGTARMRDGILRTMQLLIRPCDTRTCTTSDGGELGAAVSGGNHCHSRSAWKRGGGGSEKLTDIFTQQNK